jgi:hypothetical protein
LAAGIRLHSVKKVWGFLLVGAWALGPPIWFIWEWHANKVDVEQLKYSQELARNVWVAVVVVLAAIIGIKWGG